MCSRVSDTNCIFIPINYNIGSILFYIKSLENSKLYCRNLCSRHYKFTVVFTRMPIRGTNHVYSIKKTYFKWQISMVTIIFVCSIIYRKLLWNIHVGWIEATRRNLCLIFPTFIHNQGVKSLCKNVFLVHKDTLYSNTHRTFQFI